MEVLDNYFFSVHGYHVEGRLEAIHWWQTHFEGEVNNIFDKFGGGDRNLQISAKMFWLIDKPRPQFCAKFYGKKNSKK